MQQWNLAPLLPADKFAMFCRVRGVRSNHIKCSWMLSARALVIDCMRIASLGPASHVSAMTNVWQPDSRMLLSQCVEAVGRTNEPMKEIVLSASPALALRSGPSERQPRLVHLATCCTFSTRRPLYIRFDTMSWIQGSKTCIGYILHVGAREANAPS